MSYDEITWLGLWNIDGMSYIFSPASIYIAFMFIAAIWMPQRIHNSTAFRFSILLFVGSIVLPAAVSLIWNVYGYTTNAQMSPGTAGWTAYPSLNSGTTVPPHSQAMAYTKGAASDGARMLLAGALAIGVLSLIAPKYLRRDHESSAPAEEGPTLNPPQERSARS